MLAIVSDLFSERGDSHDALHFLFEKPIKKNTPPLIKQTIEAVFESESLRQKIKADWNLYCGYDDAKQHEHDINRYAPYDLVSRCIEECHLCFKCLIAYELVEPSFFCQTGHSFFWLAAKSEKSTRRQEKLMEYLLPLMRYEALPKPFSVRDPGEDRYSIFQASTWHKKWFRICLDQLKSSLSDDLASLGPEEIW